MALGLVTAGAAFLCGTTMIRRLRRSIVEEGTMESDASAGNSLPLHTYHAVIQQLKQQKHELQSLQQVERRRAKTTENISAAVLSNLSSGVMFFSTNGLVRQANAAAKRILGFGSPLGMSAAEIFRDTRSISGTDGQNSLTEAVQKSLRDKQSTSRIEGLYLTPAGEERILEITVTMVDTAGEVLGAACLINDQTELSHIRRKQELRGEISGEMALELRNSLTSISGYARQLATGGELDATKQLAADIVSEAAHLEHTIGSFLAEGTSHAASAGLN
jgi:PAS domain S-box-containing protein